jgi:hypothetical protein
VVFNQEIRVDLMFLDDRQPVLHVVDAGTTYQAAAFLPGEDSTTVWNTLIRCWSHCYVGHPQGILADQGSVFCSEEFKSNCAVHEIELRSTGTESHSSLGAGERYHDPLRRVYQKLSLENRYVPRESLLQASVYAMSSTMGPEGLIPALLVFGMIPRLPSPCMLPLLSQ